MESSRKISAILLQKDTIQLRTVGIAAGGIAAGIAADGIATNNIPTKDIPTNDTPANATYTVVLRVPTVCGNPAKAQAPGRIVAEYAVRLEGDILTVPRYAGAYDCLICKVEAYAAGERLPGVCYVTEIAHDVPEASFPYPKKKIKALCCTLDDVDELGVEQTSVNPNQAEIMTLQPENAIVFEYNGKPYYFKRDVVEALDAKVQGYHAHGALVLLRYINGSFLIGERAEEGIVEIIQHPDYDYTFPAAYMSSFNVRTEEGLDYFCAYTEFLAARYSRADAKYGWALSYEVGNEVTSQYIWSNAGEMACGEFMEEYVTQLRLCWLLASKHYAHYRIYTSFDQYFASCHSPSEPRRFYGMKECIDWIDTYCKRDGDLPWNVGFHPYPENLSFPDFYNDREPSYSFETRRITFKNVEVMPAYLAQPHLLYRGEPRRIILPEQGFNTRDGEAHTERQAEAAYVLAYLKIRRQPTIDLFLHHNYVDAPWEFGLNLGVRRFAGYGADGECLPGEAKPTFYAMKDMDTEREPERVAKARAFIGEQLFDWLLDPPPVLAALDHSKDGLNIPGQGNKKSADVEQQDAPLSNFDV